MEIEENVKVKGATSHLWQMIIAAAEDIYRDKLSSATGEKELFECYQDELNRVANIAFNMGREYEAKKK